MRIVDANISTKIPFCNFCVNHFVCNLLATQSKKGCLFKIFTHCMPTTAYDCLNK